MDEVVGDVAHRFTVPIVRRRGGNSLQNSEPKKDWKRFGMLLIEAYFRIAGYSPVSGAKNSVGSPRAFQCAHVQAECDS